MGESALPPQSAPAPAKRKPGRPKGSLGVPNRVRDLLLAKAEVKPLQVLLETMAERWHESKKAEGDTRKALQNEACGWAKEAAPYVHARLQATTVKGDTENPLSFVLGLPKTETLFAAIRGQEDRQAGSDVIDAEPLPAIDVKVDK